MNKESRESVETLLLAFSRLLDETAPQELMPKILEAAMQVLSADAAILDIPGETPLHISLPKNIAISESAVVQAKTENRVVLWNRVENEEDLSHSIMQNSLTSILVAPFRTPDSEDGYLYLQRAARTDCFQSEDGETFKKFLSVCEKLSFAAADRERDRNTISFLQQRERRGKILYASSVMHKTVETAEKLAVFPFPVILYGETGTGKEIFARWIHEKGPSSEKPFLALNCGAIPETLMESILFGHVKGSFTGAIENKKGIFEEAEGGTVFLDEIAELSLPMQVKLLRVLQEKHIVRVGDSREIPVNVRIIAATHVNLEQAVSQGKFREDLFFRLQVMPLEIPALRDREQDVIYLAEEFLKRFSIEFGKSKFRLSRAAEKALLAYHFPGNVRELENKIQKAFVTATGGVILPKDLGLDNLQETAKHSPRTLREAREIVERECIDQALRASGGNLTLASTVLGIDRKVLREIMERLGISKATYKISGK